MPNEINAVSVNGTEYRINYESLANLPFGVETAETFLAETSIPFNAESGTGQYGNSIPALPVPGDEYAVIWDGDEYACRCVSYGNELILESADESVLPFEISCGQYGGYYMNVYTEQTPATHVLEIRHIARTTLTLRDLPLLYIGTEPVPLLQVLNILASASGAGVTFTAEPEEHVEVIN